MEIAAADVDQFKRVFSVLRDERGVLEPWRRTSLDFNVIGKQTHDARLVAAMQKHGLSHLLTFNVGDFQRFPGVAVLHPAAVAAR